MTNMQTHEISQKAAVVALFAIIVCAMPFILARPSLKCDGLCIAHLNIKGTDIAGIVTYGESQVKNATIGMLLNGKYKDTLRVSGDMSISAPFRFGQNSLILNYRNQHAVVSFWYFDGYTDFLVVPIGICILVLLLYLSNMNAMRFNVNFHEEGSPTNDAAMQINEAVKMAIERSACTKLIKDLPINANEFAAEACLIMGEERPSNGYRYEQAMAAAAMESDLFYSDGMLIKKHDAQAVAARRVYDSAMYNGNYIINRTKSASGLLSVNKMMTAESGYADILKAVKRWGSVRLICNGHEPKNALTSETASAGLFLLRLCGKLETVAL